MEAGKKPPTDVEEKLLRIKIMAVGVSTDRDLAGGGVSVAV